MAALRAAWALRRGRTARRRGAAGGCSVQRHAVVGLKCEQAGRADCPSALPVLWQRPKGVCAAQRAGGLGESVRVPRSIGLVAERRSVCGGQRSGRRIDACASRRRGSRSRRGAAALRRHSLRTLSSALGTERSRLAGLQVLNAGGMRACVLELVATSLWFRPARGGL